MSKKTDAVSEARGAAKASGAHLTKQARMRTLDRLISAMYDRGYQVSGIKGLKEKHIAMYFDQRSADELSVRTRQNEAAHIRKAMRAVGRHQAADSPTISNKALGIDGGCRDGTKIAATDEEFQEALEVAANIDEGLVAALKLQRWLGLRSAEAIRCAGSLAKWEQDLIAGKRVTVISGTKGGRRRETRAADMGKAFEAVREALAVVAKRRGKLIDKPNLKEAMTWYRNIVHRRITQGVGIQAHALRYAYACDMMRLYHREGFSGSVIWSLVSTDLGHGDGRGRYVWKVYTRRAAGPHAESALPEIGSQLPIGGEVMSDDSKSRGEPDRSLISLSQDHEVAYWTRALDVTEEQLREAVRAVGSSAEKVREYLRSQ